MLRERSLQILPVVLLLLLSACSQRLTVPTQWPRYPSSVPATLEQQPTPKAPTTIPSITQAPLPTPGIASGPPPIEADNAGQLAVLSKLGKSTLLAAPLYSPNGRLLAVPTAVGIYIYDAGSLEELRRIPQGAAFIAFSPDGTLAAVVTPGENPVRLYELSGGSEVNQWPARAAGFAPGGQLWLEDGESVRLVYLDRNLVSAPFHGVQPAFSTDGSLMTLFSSGQVWLYDPLKGRRVRQLEDSYANLDQVLFSPDGQVVAGEVYTLRCPTCTEMNGPDRSLVLWRAADGSILARIEHPTGWAAFSTNGAWLALSQLDSLQFYETASGSLTKTMAGYYGPVAGMALSADGQTLAAVDGNDPYALRLWDLESGRVVQALRGHDTVDAGTNAPVAFSLDGKYLVVRGDVWEWRPTRITNNTAGPPGMWSCGTYRVGKNGSAWTCRMPSAGLLPRRSHPGDGFARWDAAPVGDGRGPVAPGNQAALRIDPGAGLYFRWNPPDLRVKRWNHPDLGSPRLSTAGIS